MITQETNIEFSQYTQTAEHPGLDSHTGLIYYKEIPFTSTRIKQLVAAVAAFKQIHQETPGQFLMGFAATIEDDFGSSAIFNEDDIYQLHKYLQGCRVNVATDADFAL